MNYRQHRQRWNNCKRCSLCKERDCIVLCRGTIPAKVLFIGEAPGVSEDVIGQPFLGPAGKLLDRIIRQAGVREHALTNLVACIPKEQGTKIGEPPEKAIKACSSRLRQFVVMCNPQLIVCVGRLAAKHIPSMFPKKVLLEIVHPAGILRMESTQKPLAYQRAAVKLRDAVENI